MSTPPVAARLLGRRRSLDRFGDLLLFWLTVLASLAAVVVIVAIIYKVVDGSHLAISRYGLSFLTSSLWAPNIDVNGVYGAASFLYGTAVSSFVALVLAAPIGMAIGLFLSLLAPRRTSAVIGPLVEMLAAIPSVVLGFWGILVLGPFLAKHLEPGLNSALGFIPIFGAPGADGLGLFNAALILTIMIVPIIASLSREMFVSVPPELKDGALALGATRWEMVRGVVLSSTRPGLVAASILGLGRALGEAIAVTQVDGGGSQSGIHADLFASGDTIASRIASQFPGATSKLEFASLFYLALILLVIGLIANLSAQWIIRRHQLQHGTV